jgi:hypothetical protein
MSAREYHWKVTGWRAVILACMLLSPYVAIPFIAGFVIGRAS